MRKFVIVASGLVLTVAIGGCHSSVNTVKVGESQPQFQWIQTDKVLSEQTTVVSAKKIRENGLLKMQVELINSGRDDERFLYKIEWLDADGFELKSISTGWMAKVIQGKETMAISAIAPDPRATDCRLKLQENAR